MINAHARQIAVMVAAAGSLIVSAIAQPPARQVPIVRTPTPGQPASQPTQPSSPSQPTTGTPQTAQPGGTVPVSLGGQTINVSPNDAASIAAWREKLRQFAIAKGIDPISRADGLPTYINSKDYIVPTGDGTKQGIVSLPANFQVGAWFSGTAANGNKPSQSGQPNPASSDPAQRSTAAPTTLLQLAATSGAKTPTEIPQLNQVPMTPEAVEAARKQFPKEQGWKEVGLGNGGKIFVKANSADLANGLITLAQSQSSKTDTNIQSVNDLVQAYKIWDGQCECMRTHVVRDTSSHARAEVAESPKYTIDASVVPAQIQLIEASQKTIQDDGQLERALAITEMQQLPTWKRGVQRLADVYLAHPELAHVAPAQDFSDLTSEAIRKMINTIVADANRNSDPKGLVAAAALMATERRVEPALNTLSRARKLSTEQTDKDAIDGLFSAINGLPRQ